MSINKDIKTAAALLRARVFGRREPFFVQLMPTEHCNLRCRYCYAEFGNRVREDFPIEPLLRVIDGLAGLGTRVIMVAGGEPTLYPDLGRVIDRITGHGIECSVNTNGLMVPARIDELIHADMLSISLDGPEEIHDFYRGKGTYQHVVEAIALARSRGLRVQIQFTLTRDLINSFQHVHELATRHSCFIGINFLRPQETVDGSRNEASEADNEEVGGFLAWLLKEKPRTIPYPDHLIRYVQRWPYGFGHHFIRTSGELKEFKPIPCYSGRFLMAIDNVGDIYPCTKLYYTEPLGNCLNGDIERAWKNLEPVRCEACLDLGCNLMNDFLRLSPATLVSLLGVWHRKGRQ